MASLGSQYRDPLSHAACLDVHFLKCWGKDWRGERMRRGGVRVMYPQCSENSVVRGQDWTSLLTLHPHPRDKELGLSGKIRTR